MPGEEKVQDEAKKELDATNQSTLETKVKANVSERVEDRSRVHRPDIFIAQVNRPKN